MFGAYRGLQSFLGSPGELEVTSRSTLGAQGRETEMRKILKWGLPLVAASAVAGSALLPVASASATATTYDYTIKLVSIQCNKKQDVDRDEPYLKINGTQVWSATKVKKGQTINLTGTDFDFNGIATMELMEKDSGND